MLDKPHFMESGLVGVARMELAGRKTAAGNSPHFIKCGEIPAAGGMVKKGGFWGYEKGVFWGTKTPFLGVRKGGFLRRGKVPRESGGFGSKRVGKVPRKKILKIPPCRAFGNMV